MKIINVRIDFFSVKAREAKMKVESKMLMSQIQKYVDERRKKPFR